MATGCAMPVGDRVQSLIDDVGQHAGDLSRHVRYRIPVVLIVPISPRRASRFSQTLAAGPGRGRCPCAWPWCRPAVTWPIPAGYGWTGRPWSLRTWNRSCPPSTDRSKTPPSHDRRIGPPARTGRIKPVRSPGSTCSGSPMPAEGALRCASSGNRVPKSRGPGPADSLLHRATDGPGPGPRRNTVRSAQPLAPEPSLPETLKISREYGDTRRESLFRAISLSR